MPRLILTHLTLVDFKSYAGKHVLGPFKPSFSCILGANGSGKSNVIDALLFVFGWRARALRHARLADLIHTSAERPAPDSARVDVHFVLWDDTQNAAVAGSELVISRVVRRKNSDSHYEINSMRATQADLISFMQERGMDISSHRFLILQGDVEHISLLKPKNAESLLELQTDLCLRHFREQLEGQPNLDSVSVSGDHGFLEFIEGVVGTQKYIPLIAKLAAETQLCEEARSQSRTRLRTVVAYRDELEEQHVAAVESLKALVEGTKQCARHSQVQMFLLQKSMEAEYAQRAQLRHQGEELTTRRLEPVNRDIAALEREIGGVIAQIADLTGHLEGKCVERMRELEVERKICREKIDFYGSELQRYAADIATQEALIKQSQDELQAFPETETNLRQQIATVERTIADLTGQLTEWDGTGSRQKKASDELEGISQSIMPLRKQLIGVNARLTAVLQSGLATATALGELCCTIMAWLYMACGSLRVLDKEVDTFADSLQLLANVEERLAEVQSLQSTSKALQTEKAQVQSAIFEKETQLKSLSATQDQIKEQTDTERMLLDAQSRRLLKGIYGRVGNLASVGSQEVNLAAISAFGGALNTIVVDTMENIGCALQFLRQKNRGVTHFIDLSRVTEQYRRHLARSPQVNVPAGTALFLDQLRVHDETYRPALWSVIRDTLLCEDINLANKLTSRRDCIQKIVTYNGDVFDPSGVISGGGDKTRLLHSGKGFVLAANTRDRGRDGAKDEVWKEKQRKELAAEIATLEKNLAEINAKIEQCHQQSAQSNVSEQDLAKVAVMAHVAAFQERFASAKDIVFRAASTLRSSFSSSVLAKFSIQVNSAIKKEVSELYHVMSTCDIAGGPELINFVRNVVVICPALMSLFDGMTTEFPEASDALHNVLSSAHTKLAKASALVSLFTQALFPYAAHKDKNGDTDADIARILDQCADAFSARCGPSNIFVFQTDVRQTILMGDQELQLQSKSESLLREIQTLEALAAKAKEDATDSRQAEIQRALNSSAERLKELTSTLQTATANQKKLNPRIVRSQKQIEEVKSTCARLTGELDSHRQRLQEIEQLVHLSAEEIPKLRAEIEGLKSRTKESNNHLSHATAQREAILRELEEIEQNMQAISQEIQGKEAERRRYASKYAEYLRLLDRLADVLRLTVFDFGQLNIEFSEHSVEVLTNRQSMKALAELCLFPQREVDSPETAELVLELYQDIKVDKKTVKSVDTGLDLTASIALLTEYRTRALAVFERQSEFQAISAQYEEKKDELNAMRDQRASEFVAAFTLINTYLRDIYKTLTLGGDAQLEFVNQFDPFDGILFSVMPPRKSWKQICNLSGGEKTLSSLSLIFALHCFSPTPLYVMDEIDAALDFRNVSVIANYIKNKTRSAQFVVISLRNNTFELADRLVGIYKQENCSHCIVCDPNTVLRKIQTAK